MFAEQEREKPIRLCLDAFTDDPSGLSIDRVEAGFVELQRLSQAVEAKRLRWLAELEKRASYRRNGYLSSAAWLSDRFGLAFAAAKQEVKVATALGEMPAAREALSSGEVSTGAVRVLVGARDAHPEAFSDQEGALVSQAQARSVDELRAVIREWSRSVDEEDALQAAERLRERRHLKAFPDATGMIQVRGELDPETGEAVITALQALVDSGLRAGGSADLRTPPQRRADALGELARFYLDRPERPIVAGERPHLTVTVDVATLEGKAAPKGRSELDHAGAVHPELSRRLACDASVMRVVMAGPSEPIDLGRRTPVIPSHLRRAVMLRDGRCQFPGCKRPPVWCDVHHVRHWADGGSTSLCNLILLCRSHHRLVHEGGFGLELVDTKPVFSRPDGSILEDRAPP
jgi:hypothetical protein